MVGMARSKETGLVLHAANKLRKHEPLGDDELVAVRSFADGALQARAEARAEMYAKLWKAEEKLLLSLWDSEALDLPPGETIVVKRYRWDGENRHSMVVDVRIKGYAKRAGKPRGVGLAKEHPGITTLFLFLAYRPQVGNVQLSERQALAMTRKVFPECPEADRVGRLRRVKRQLVAATEGHPQGPLFDVIKPIILEQSAVKLLKALRLGQDRLELDKPARDEFRRAVDEIEERSRPLLKAKS